LYIYYFTVYSDTEEVPKTKYEISGQFNMNSTYYQHTLFRLSIG